MYCIVFLATGVHPVRHVAPTRRHLWVQVHAWVQCSGCRSTRGSLASKPLCRIPQSAAAARARWRCGWGNQGPVALHLSQASDSNDSARGVKGGPSLDRPAGPLRPALLPHYLSATLPRLLIAGQAPRAVRAHRGTSDVTVSATMGVRQSVGVQHHLLISSLQCLRGRCACIAGPPGGGGRHRDRAEP
jgi:hypothetical protein